LLLCASALLALSRYSLLAAAISGLVLSLACAIYGFGRLAYKTELGGRLGQLAGVAQHWMKRLGVWHE
jgi:hypothetical protein